MKILTFVFGPSYMIAADYIRSRVSAFKLNPNDFRNITNPQSLRGLKSTENTKIRFIWLDGCRRQRDYFEMKDMLAAAQASGANIEEIKDRY